MMHVAEHYIRPCTNKLIDCVAYRAGEERQAFSKAALPYCLLSGLVLSSARLVAYVAPIKMAALFYVVGAVALIECVWTVITRLPHYRLKKFLRSEHVRELSGLHVNQRIPEKLEKFIDKLTENEINCLTEKLLLWAVMSKEAPGETVEKKLFSFLKKERYSLVRDAVFVPFLEAAIPSSILTQVAVFKDETSYNLTALMYAACAGNLALVRLLIRAGASLTDQNTLSRMAIHDAIDAGYIELFESILPPGGMTALMYVVSCAGYAFDYAQRLELVKRLLKNDGAVVADRNPMNGMTPLMYAAAYGDMKLVQALLDAGALLTDRDFNGMTPLMHAIKNSPNHIRGAEIIAGLFNAGSPLTDRDHQGETVLMYAVRLEACRASIEPSTELVQKLLTYPSIQERLEEQNLEGMTALLITMQQEGKSSLPIMHALIQAGANFSEITSRLPLMRKRPVETALILLMGGWRLQNIDEEGKTCVFDDIEATINGKITTNETEQIGQKIAYSKLLLTLRYLRSKELAGDDIKQCLFKLAETSFKFTEKNPHATTNYLNFKLIKKLLHKEMKRMM